MRLTGSISEASRLLPVLRGRTVAPVLTRDAVQPATAAPPRPAVWTLSRETAGAAVAAQMLNAPRRGLKADADERDRFTRSYLKALGLRWNDLFPEAGLAANDIL